VPTPQDLQADVLVVGAGTSGIVAAVTAARSGAKVIVIEKNSYVGGVGLVSFCYANFGGGTDYQKQAGINDTPEQFYADMRVWDPRADSQLLKAFCETAPPVCHFLRDLGIEWVLTEESSNADMGMNVLRQHVVVGKGPAFYKVMVPAFAKAGGTLLTSTKGTKLLTDGKGAVTGISARKDDGSFAIKAKATLLACGGFEANEELITRYVSSQANYAMLRGLPTATGDGLLMGLDVGAKTRGLDRVHGYVHLPPNPVVYPLRPFSVIPVDGSAMLPRPTQDFPYGIVVNMAGERFVDETVPRVGENMCNALLHQPGALGFAIIDQPLFDKYWRVHVSDVTGYWAKLGLGPVRVVTADTIEALAIKVGVNPPRLGNIVTEYNEAVDRGTSHLLPIPKTNKDALGYYQSQKVNYLHKIESPPFFAVMIIAGVSHTGGGLAINAKCQVLDRDGAPIRGLYAGGDTSVLWQSNYGSAYARALITGHIAANTITATEN
jgi:fumarate reductase flavoprotein subunit